ncbi:hypothetical protein HanXRQr2_Chr06g0277341 [Helianthus annuus]|uniref:Uncharacterized protein n=1 Tax=Helianthus annuus TaxID=4232 RepID=A0A9K3IWI8_HELAN|nr:hypothetical protein HanXRQr2_Chr06g0277341 [Helianthus annuus]
MTFFGTFNIFTKAVCLKMFVQEVKDSFGDCCFPYSTNTTYSYHVNLTWLYKLQKVHLICTGV